MLGATLGISAVIPTREQRPDLLHDAVASALELVSDVVVVIDRCQDADVLRGLPVRTAMSPGVGVSAALNEGVRVASGDRIAFLDSDDVWLPAKRKQFAAEGATFTDYIREGVEVRCTRKPSTMFSDNVVCRSTTVVPRWMFDAVGGFDEPLVWAQDWDFHCAIQRTFWWSRVPVLGSEIRDQAHGHTKTAPSGERSRHCARVRRRWRT